MIHSANYTKSQVTSGIQFRVNEGLSDIYAYVHLHFQPRFDIFNLLELPFRDFDAKNILLELSGMQFGYFHSFNLFHNLCTTVYFFLKPGELQCHTQYFALCEI